MGPTISQNQNFSVTMIPTGVPTRLQNGTQGQVFQRVIHYRYPEAPESAMVPIDRFHRQKLLPAAASAFKTMQADARKEGIQVEPVSAYRSMEVQKDVFYTEAVHQGVTLAERSKVAAPPGFSEHATGYVVDLMDASSPATARLDLCFEQTPAFKWLMRHANRYGFELSFPPKNVQGVNAEPWHFRYVGDPMSQQVFRQARQAQARQGQSA